MRLTKQRHNECLLASLCMLTGADYQLASDNFRARYGVAWGGGPDNELDKSVPHWLEFAREYLHVKMPSAVAGPYAVCIGQDTRVFKQGGVMCWANFNTMQAHATAYDPATQSILDPAGRMMGFCDYQRITAMQFMGCFILEKV